MESNSNSSVMKSVKDGVVAFLGYLVIDFISSESQAEVRSCNPPNGAPWGFDSPSPLRPPV